MKKLVVLLMTSIALSGCANNISPDVEEANGKEVVDLELSEDNNDSKGPDEVGSVIENNTVDEEETGDVGEISEDTTKVEEETGEDIFSIDTDAVDDTQMLPEYKAFLCGETKAYYSCGDGEQMDIEELYLYSRDEKSIYEKYDEIRVAFFENFGKQYLVLEVGHTNHYGDYDSLYCISYIITKKDDGIYITHEEEQWDRREFTIYKQGVITDAGSSGASDHGYSIGYINEDGIYECIADCRYCGPGWIKSMTAYNQAIKFSEQSIEYAGVIDLECDIEPYISVSMNEMSGKVYASLDPEDTLPQQYIDYMDSTEKDGLIWIKGDEIEQLIEDDLVFRGYPEQSKMRELDWTVLK